MSHDLRAQMRSGACFNPSFREWRAWGSERMVMTDVIVGKIFYLQLRISKSCLGTSWSESWRNVTRQVVRHWPAIPQDPS